MIENAEQAKQLVTEYSKKVSEKYVTEILIYVEKAASNGQSKLDIPAELAENWVCTARTLRVLGFMVYDGGAVYDDGFGEKVDGPSISW